MTETALAQLAPEHIRSISRYIAGKPTDELARELGLDPTTIVKLASNENPRGPGPSVRAAIAEAVAELPRYPDSNGFALKAALSRRLSVAPEQLVLGNGSNDVLELVTLAFLQPGDEAVYAQHAFIVYPLATQARGARGIEVPAKDFGHDLAAMRAAITPKTRVRVHRESEQPDRNVDSARRRSRRSSLRCRAMSSSCSTRPTTSTWCPRTGRRASSGSRATRTSSSRERSRRPTVSRRCASATASWMRRSRIF